MDGEKGRQHLTIDGSAPAHRFIILWEGSIMCDYKREMTKQEMIEEIRSLIDENAALKSKLEDVY